MDENASGTLNEFCQIFMHSFVYLPCNPFDLETINHSY